MKLVSFIAALAALISTTGVSVLAAPLVRPSNFSRPSWASAAIDTTDILAHSNTSSLRTYPGYKPFKTTHLPDLSNVTLSRIVIHGATQHASDATDLDVAYQQ
ncbi:hypothetical protein B7494_g4476 [Chlorociboria aeruginascens]|nr:hypothetical protein B7494_g4476 [Chlorociboria aeruginascens]